LQISSRCSADAAPIHASTPGFSGGLALTGVLKPVDDATIAAGATSPFGGNVHPYSARGRVPIAEVTSVELALGGQNSLAQV